MEINFSAALGEEERINVPIIAEFNLDVAKARFKDSVEKIDSLVNQAEALVINTEATNTEAVALGTTAKQIYKRIENQRKEIIDSPNEFVKAVNSFCKIFTDKLKNIEDMMKIKIAQYRSVQEQARREAEIAARKATEELQEKLNKQAEKTGTEPVKVIEPILPRQEKITRAETGSAYAKKHWTFKVIDQSLVPREYLLISDAKVRDAIKAGIRNIPGLEIYEESLTTFRT